MRRFLTAICFLLISSNLAASPGSVAVFYGAEPPWPELAQFDWVVLEPSHATPEGLTILHKDGSQAFAYMALGELLDEEAAGLAQHPDWALGRNSAWASKVMDLASPGWQAHLLQQARNYQAQGYQGLFLDTLDSFQLLPEAERPAQLAGLKQLIERLHSELPAMKLFFNRGFEVIDELSWKPAAVAAESLYAGWNQALETYGEVSAADQEWLRKKLAGLQQRDIPVVVIDYLPPERRDEARQLAKRLSAEGYIPWISTPALDYLGISSLEVQPRRIALIYDPREGDLSATPGHTIYAGLLEYLGYRVDYFAASDELPAYPTRGLYAGIVLWMSTGPLLKSAGFERWLLAQKDQGVPMAFIAGLPLEQQRTLKALGLQRGGTVKGPLQVSMQAPGMFGFEGPLVPRRHNLEALRVVSAQVTPLLQFSGPGEQLWTVAGLADWGGFALDPAVLEQGAEGRRRWILDPFAFIQKALRLPVLPVLDSTTENGRRIATVHIDGDGFVSRAEVPGSPYSGQLILDRFLSKYPLLATVSVIEGEVGPQGMYPWLSPELEPIARKIFAQPSVEVANHTYSHPFFWEPEKARQEEGFTEEYGMHLNIPGYSMDLRREVLGTQDYINSRLTTPQKPVKVMLWSGDALPDEAALRLSYQGGMENFNGGVTNLTDTFPSLTELYPLVRPVNGLLQFYAPITNENLYTNLWTGPFYGFRDVLQTFKLTDEPRRLRPMSLYYHFYLGTKQAGIDSLHDIYRYMLGEKPLSLWVSDFIQREKGAYYASIALRPDGSYQLRALQGLRTLRLPKSLGWPDLQRSTNVAGVRDLPQGRYVHLSGPQATLYLRQNADPGPSLFEANLPLTSWKRDEQGRIRLSFAGQFPLSFSVQASGKCRLQIAGQSLTATADGKLQRFSLRSNQVDDALLDCR